MPIQLEDSARYEQLKKSLPNLLEAEGQDRDNALSLFSEIDQRLKDPKFDATGLRYMLGLGIDESSSLINTAKSMGGIGKLIQNAKWAETAIARIGLVDPGKVVISNPVDSPTSERLCAKPYITIKAVNSLSFASGSSKLSPAFHDTVETEVIKDIEKNIIEHHINLIEVIGHTDGMPVKTGNRTMDTNLELIASQTYDPNRKPNAAQGSNTDLGMLRAVEVVKLLRHLRSRGKLLGIDPDKGFRAYSSGQLTMPDHTLSNGQGRKDDESRRRIEIRLTQLGDEIAH